jgi:hypothetical protein
MRIDPLVALRDQGRVAMSCGSRECRSCLRRSSRAGCRARRGVHELVLRSC